MTKAIDRKRTGKTKRDRDSGATARNATNKSEREAWMRENNNNKPPFPKHTCNGKKNRSRITGKNNTVITL